MKKLVVVSSMVLALSLGLAASNVFAADWDCGCQKTSAKQTQNLMIPANHDFSKDVNQQGS